MFDVSAQCLNGDVLLLSNTPRLHPRQHHRHDVFFAGCQVVNLEHCFVRNTVRHSVCGKPYAVVIAGYQLLTAQKPLSIRIRRCDRIDRLAGHSVS